MYSEQTVRPTLCGIVLTPCGTEYWLSSSKANTTAEMFALLREYRANGWTLVDVVITDGAGAVELEAKYNVKRVVRWDVRQVFRGGRQSNVD